MVSNYQFSEEKLGRLEKQYKNVLEENEYGSRITVEERVLSYQKQLEERAKTEIKLEVCLCYFLGRSLRVS